MGCLGIVQTAPAVVPYNGSEALIFLHLSELLNFPKAFQVDEEAWERRK